MKNQPLYLSLLGFVLVCQSACYSFRNSYIPITAQTPMHKEAGETKVEASFLTTELNVSGSRSLTDQWAVGGSVHLGLLGQVSGEVTGTYFRNIGKKQYFDLTTGWGMSWSKYKKSLPSCLGGILGLYCRNYEDIDMNILYQKLYVQPGWYTHPSRNFSIGLHSRISLTHYFKYYYDHSFNVQNNDYSGSLGYDEYNSFADLKHPFSMTVEPILTMKFHVNSTTSWFIETSAVFSTRIGGSASWAWRGLAHPIHNKLSVLVGLQWQFSKGAAEWSTRQIKKEKDALKQEKTISENYPSNWEERWLQKDERLKSKIAKWTNRYEKFKNRRKKTIADGFRERLKNKRANLQIGWRKRLEAK